MEVERKYPEVATWLKAQQIKQITITYEVLQLAQDIKSELEIEGENNHSKGVGENDI